MLNNPLPVRRSVFVALAAIALMFALLRPVCEQWLAHGGAGAAAASAATLAASAPLEHDGDPAVQCCASVSDTNWVAPLQAASGSLEASQELAPAALVAVVIITAILAQQLHWLRAPPRSPQSFYLRSARILR